jgi:GGDEF domain-containing protein
MDTRRLQARTGIVRRYRMGGDEFCIVAEATAGAADAIAGLAAAALSRDGEGFDVGCAYGVAVIPAEATTASEALRLADRRMYAQKHASSGLALRAQPVPTRM